MRFWSGRPLSPRLTDGRAPFPCRMQALASHPLSVKERVVSVKACSSVTRVKSLLRAFQWKVMRLLDKPFFLLIRGPPYESFLFSLISLTANLPLPWFFVNKPK